MDPDIEKSLSGKESQIDVDWCPYEGMIVQGFPILTMLRGKIIMQDGQFTGAKGAGQFVKRAIDPAVLRAPVV